jgi:glycosyltransferase involved in cell wall biosynthesis
MERKHVLHIRDSGGIFGGERAILTLARNLDRELYDLTLLCMRRPDGRSERFISLAQRMGIQVEALNVSGRLDVKAVLQLRDFIRANAVSIIHTHDFKSNFYGIWATMKMNVGKVATAHGSTRDSLLKKAYLFYDEHLTYRFFHKIITVSQELHEQLSGHAAVRGKLAVIPNGLDPELLGFTEGNDEAPLSFPRKPGMKTFAVVGRLFPDKGQSLFIKAFAQIAQEFPDAAGLIAGDGPVRNDILKLIDSLGLSQRVHYCGVRMNMKEIYDLTDFLVIPSYTEGLPYVLLEAMALGIPILSTSVGDIPRIIRHGVTGYLVPPGDAQAMSGRMKELMRAPSVARIMATAGKRFVHENCSARKMARMTEDLYQSLVR